MKSVKYIDVEHELVDLQKVLAESLKSSRLNIAELDHNCEKFCSLIKDKPELEKAKYVIYSENMLPYHNNEMFVFINESGSNIEFVYGREIWLYDMISKCVIVPERNKSYNDYF